MILRADHVAGGVFVALGLLVFALGGDLPFGTLAQPGAGMMPKLLALLMITLAGMVMLGAEASRPLAAIRWSDLGHAGQLVLITSVAIASYTRLGFLITMALLVFALLVVVERRDMLRAGLYSVGLTLFAYWLFGKALKAPLPRGLFWF